MGEKNPHSLILDFIQMIDNKEGQDNLISPIVTKEKSDDYLAHGDYDPVDPF
jgi:hypothetical protein